MGKPQLNLSKVREEKKRKKRRNRYVEKFENVIKKFREL
jgi:hypothetical protein